MASIHPFTPAARPMPLPSASVRLTHLPGSRAPDADARWPTIVAALVALREQGRRAVRIVDLDCGDGALLLLALRRASELGFVAIEGRGVDGAPALVAAAQARAAALRDPAIGASFAVEDVMAVLGQEAELPADILLWHSNPRARDGRALRDALHCAGKVVIADACR